MRVDVIPQLAQEAKAVLGNNAAVVALKTSRWEDANWRLCAYALADGRQLWQCDLPTEPIYEGLCLDRNGNVNVVLVDGQVTWHGR